MFCCDAEAVERLSITRLNVTQCGNGLSAFTRDHLAQTAQKYMASFQRARFEPPKSKGSAQDDVATDAIDFCRHERRSPGRLTDDTGILQHAIFSVPNSTKAIRRRQARALVVSILWMKSRE